jgi:ketosteroid isomerase-like protein
MGMTRTEIQAMFREWDRAWDARDDDAIMSFMTDDCYYEEIDGRSATGRDAVRQLLLGSLAGSGYTFTWREDIIDGEQGKVVGSWDFHLPIGDGREWTLHGLDVYTLKDGKIWEKRVYGKSYGFVGDTFVDGHGSPFKPEGFGYRPTPGVSAG